MKFDWNEFDPESYLAHNYAEAREDDLRFTSATGDFFLSHLGGRSGLRGVDVGPGTNLYPALTMLPFCREITLVEYSEASRRWLEREIAPGYSSTWEPFWKELEPKERYRETEDPVRALATRAKVQPGRIFGLPRNTWDLGTMFFVAEAIAADEEEFQTGLRRFIDSLVPGAPFATAFMENSEGYSVGGRFFPAHPISMGPLRECLEELAEDEICFTREGVGRSPLRQGYTGMILACGRKRLDRTGTEV